MARAGVVSLCEEGADLVVEVGWGRWSIHGPTINEVEVAVWIRDYQSKNMCEYGAKDARQVPHQLENSDKIKQATMSNQGNGGKGQRGGTRQLALDYDSLG
jgi:hypothetical protein